MNSSMAIDPLEKAAFLMDKFASRTGLISEKGAAHQRYLWTDAFAVLNFLALSQLGKKMLYEKSALDCIKAVHDHLGKFAPNDSRTGWISDLPENRAENHPTINGLRIGKKRLERKQDDTFNERLEWERDGQYFHYHTRWIHALLKAGECFGKEKFLQWAMELSLAGSKFIKEEDGRFHMFWKMSVDLSRPLIPRMGAHDPLEGLLCALQAREMSVSNSKKSENYITQLKKICDQSYWGTTDALGIGGLLLNVVRATELQKSRVLPDSVKPRRLLRDAEQGLEEFYKTFDPEKSATYRLAFRECGLSIGLRCLQKNIHFLEQHDVQTNISSEIMAIAEQIETFWLSEKNQQALTFKDHIDINEVSLAASLLSKKAPEIYTRFNHNQ